MIPIRQIALVVHSLTCGGAQHVMSRMANYWAGLGWDVTIVTIDTCNDDFFPLDRRVRRVALGLAGDSNTLFAALKNNLARLKRLRAEIQQLNPDAVISFMDSTNVLALLATRGLSVPVIISERGDPRRHPLTGVWSYLRRNLYRQADVLVVQTEAVKSWAQDMVPQVRVCVIPNSVSIAEGDAGEQAQMDIDGPFVVALGRLVPDKGFDLLLEAFARCSRKHRDWSLVILGEGAERERLTARAAQLGLAARVYLPGRVKTPAAVLRKANLFVLSSRTEGFPNALMEAMSSGLPVISFDCPSGPSEIIRHGIDGVLVPPESIDDLADAMDRLMGDEGKRRQLGEQALQITERYSMDKEMQRWEQAIWQAAHTVEGMRIQGTEA